MEKKDEEEEEKAKKKKTVSRAAAAMESNVPCMYVIQRYLEIVLLVLARCWQPSVHLFFLSVLFIRHIASMKACIRVIFTHKHARKRIREMEMKWKNEDIYV